MIDIIVFLFIYFQLLLIKILSPRITINFRSINFNVAAHNPAFTSNGNIRLVCANITFDGKGNTLAEYFTEEAPNGSIAITSA